MCDGNIRKHILDSSIVTWKLLRNSTEFMDIWIGKQCLQEYINHVKSVVVYVQSPFKWMLQKVFKKAIKALWRKLNKKTKNNQQMYRQSLLKSTQYRIVTASTRMEFALGFKQDAKSQVKLSFCVLVKITRYHNMALCLCLMLCIETKPFVHAIFDMIYLRLLGLYTQPV